ncbi:MAG: hypothetical protein ACREFE_07495 [Limisphaerales bacterium]
MDTGCNYEGWLTPEVFQQWTNETKLPLVGETRRPYGVLGGMIYSNVDLPCLWESTSNNGDFHRAFNGIGLSFLARNLVTFDFPKKKLYLKCTGVASCLTEARHQTNKIRLGAGNSKIGQPR